MFGRCRRQQDCHGAKTAGQFAKATSPDREDQQGQGKDGQEGRQGQRQSLEPECGGKGGHQPRVERWRRVHGAVQVALDEELTLRHQIEEIADMRWLTVAFEVCSPVQANQVDERTDGGDHEDPCRARGLLEVHVGKAKSGSVMSLRSTSGAVWAGGLWLSCVM